MALHTDLDLTVKALDDGARELHGLATTADRDRRGDIVDPLGVRCTNPLPLLWQHDTTKPVGTVTLGTPTRDGVPFVARIPRLTTPGILKDRVDEAWQSLTAGLVRFVSIGYRATADAMSALPGGGTRFASCDVYELSLVTVPANGSARILATSAVASLAGASAAPTITPGGASPVTRRGEPMTTAEQIQQYSNARAPKVARMQALMSSAAEANATLDPAQAEDYDALELEVKSIDAHLVRLRASETLAATQAVAPVVTRAAGGFGNTPTYPTISVRSNVPQGTAFVRAAMALGAANGDHYRAMEIAKQWKSSTPEVELYLKAAVAPGNTTDATWAGPLAVMTNVTNEFISLLHPRTILGKIPGLTKVPFNTNVPSQTAGGVYSWVGQGAPKPVTSLGFGTVNLGINKVAGIIILTEELVRNSTPSAEDVVRKNMIEGIASFLDQQFIDPAAAPVPGVSPGSITNGTPTAGASSGDPLTDLHTLASVFAMNNIPVAGLVVIMSETNAFTMGGMMNASGAPVFPGVGADGGAYRGMTILPSNHAGTNVIALQPPLVLYADDGGVTIDVSREAAVQMDSAPTGDGTGMTSLWQANLVGLRAERFITWKRANINAVRYITGATYVPPAPGGGVTRAPEGNGRAAKNA